MQVRVFKPAKTAMQSGRAKLRDWVMEFEPQSRKEADQLMGWIGSDDTTGQIRMMFASKTEALAFAQRNGYDVIVTEPKQRKLQIKSYADNFAYKRVI